MDFFDGHYYRINKLILSFVGLWPYQRIRTEYSMTKECCLRTIIEACAFLPPPCHIATAPHLNIVHCTISSFYTSSVLQDICPKVIYVVKFLNDLDRLLGSMPTSVGGIIITSKVITLMYKSAVMKDLLDQMHEDWNNLASVTEEDILKKYAELGRKFTLSYAFIVFPPVVGYILLPLNAPILDIIRPLNESRTRVLPNPGEYFIDQEKYYYLLILSQCYAYVIGISVVLGCDAMYIVFMQHGCGMFAILSHRLQNMLIRRGDSSDDVLTRVEMEREVYLHVVQCIKLHVQIKRFVELIASAFTTFLLFDIGLGIVLHSTSCVMIVIRTDQTSDLVHFSALVVAQSVRLFLNSWPGQNLMDHSTHISIAAYNGLWYDIPLGARRLLLLLMMTGQSPSTLTIAGLYVVNLDSFGLIMKTSVSYCTVMASLHDSSTE